jgi:hypothetical protein
VASATSVDPAWKVVYGTVERGPKYTTFYVEVVRQQNGLRIFRRMKHLNDDLDGCPPWYGLTLDGMIAELDEQLSR